jgi:hypothetical protein
VDNLNRLKQKGNSKFSTFYISDAYQVQLFKEYLGLFGDKVCKYSMIIEN